MVDNRCEGGCKRHWTFEWLHAETGSRWQLCDIHSERSVDILDDLGFWAFPKPTGAEEPRLEGAL